MSNSDVARVGYAGGDNIKESGVRHIYNNESASLDFSGAEIKGKFELRGNKRVPAAIGGEKATLASAAIGKEVVFEHLRIEDELCLNQAEIGGRLGFNKVEVQGPVNIQNATVQGDVEIDDLTVRTKRHPKDLKFKDADDLDFSHSQFNADCTLVECEINQSLLAKTLSVKGRLLLLGGHIKEQLWLDRASVSGDISLNKVMIGEHIRARRSTDPNRFILEDSVIFGSGLQCAWLDFSGVEVCGSATFENIIADNVRFEPLGETACTFDGGLSFHSAKVDQIDLFGVHIGGPLQLIRVQSSLVDVQSAMLLNDESEDPIKWAHPTASRVDLDHAIIHRDVYLVGVKVGTKHTWPSTKTRQGDVSLIGAQLGGLKFFNERLLDSNLESLRKKLNRQSILYRKHDKDYADNQERLLDRIHERKELLPDPSECFTQISGNIRCESAHINGECWFDGLEIDCINPKGAAERLGWESAPENRFGSIIFDGATLGQGIRTGRGASGAQTGRCVSARISAVNTKIHNDCDLSHMTIMGWSDPHPPEEETDHSDVEGNIAFDGTGMVVQGTLTLPTKHKASPCGNKEPEEEEEEEEPPGLWHRLISLFRPPAYEPRKKSTDALITGRLEFNGATIRHLQLFGHYLSTPGITVSCELWSSLKADTNRGWRINIVLLITLGILTLISFCSGLYSLISTNALCPLHADHFWPGLFLLLFITLALIFLAYLHIFISSNQFSKNFSKLIEKGKVTVTSFRDTISPSRREKNSAMAFIVLAGIMRLFARYAEWDIKRKPLVDLERATIDELEIREPFPGGMDLTNAKIGEWSYKENTEMDCDQFEEMLERMNAFKRSVYLDVERNLRGRGMTDGADRIHRLMNLRELSLWGMQSSKRVGRFRSLWLLLHGLIGFGTSRRWMLSVLLLWFAFTTGWLNLGMQSLVEIDPQIAVELESDSDSTLKEELTAGLEQGIIGKLPLAAGIALRSHVPVVPWDPVSEYRATDNMRAYLTCVTAVNWIIIPIIIASLLPKILPRRLAEG